MYILKSPCLKIYVFKLDNFILSRGNNIGLGAWEICLQKSDNGRKYMTSGRVLASVSSHRDAVLVLKDHSKN